MDTTADVPPSSQVADGLLSTENALSMFTSYAESLHQTEQVWKTLHEHAKALDDVLRAQLAVLQQVHSAPQETTAVVERALPFIAQLTPLFAALAAAVPAGSFYRYRDAFKTQCSQFVFQAAFLHWLQTGQLITHQATADLISVSSNGDDGSFSLAVEDYLLAVCQLPPELARLCMNCVTAGDFVTPLKISKFVNELFCGFQQLNLKNDALRRKYDGIKYAVKRIEEVVYDLTLRGLAKSQ
mmetsp:Transcript_14704/g.44149  ORF Transcript_14704/g.44149 Transcript_14704/m.44149 type:complete len:241 (-) Transcript_14704:73-795(-)|eukprot:CAMPEP_0177639606 /NCGR_PEP_ID=MMETSP0447-20121125/6110_1 /TAXON_ID=0 /ORGANISM="Stygamoeba regulata, Strain BSH-02190019" /LENGTH=240 /DNA_ID=CAMNT_0019141643 /DNA_START=82 /DNA_END=804 /DNA_ORIENTATION=+